MGILGWQKDTTRWKKQSFHPQCAFNARDVAS